MRKVKWQQIKRDNPLSAKDIKRYISDLYVDCYCGSGKKYKFCCYMKKDREMHNPAEVYNYMVSNRKIHRYCIYQNCECSNKIIKSHSIQNNKILNKLAVDNHVYIADFNSNVFGCTDLKRCGRNEATTSTCFCSFHDTKIFLPIESSNYNYTEEQNFLYAYRAFSKYYYDRIVGLEDYKNIFGIVPNISMLIGCVDRIKGLEISVSENEDIKLLFNEALEREDYSVVKTIVLKLNYEIGFATSYMSPLSYDLEGNLISNVYCLEGRMRNIFVNIFPENGNTYALISWLNVDDGEWFQKYEKQFDTIKENEKMLIRVLNNMVACQSDNVVFGKRLLDVWGETTKRKFLDQYVSSFVELNGENVGLSIEKNICDFRCGFNLFERV